MANNSANLEQRPYEHLKHNAEGGIPPYYLADDLAKAPVACGRSITSLTFSTRRWSRAPPPPNGPMASSPSGPAPKTPSACAANWRTFNLPADSVRVIVPDFGGGFGGKHQGDPAIEAARLSQNVAKPVRILWTRQEEFTWAYFRPAGVILAEAALDPSGAITSWYFLNINSGQQATESPYRAGRHQSGFVPSDPPLRQGSYRALASTANNFAREVFIDELAAAAKIDPLRFRLMNLDNARLKNVLQTAADKFGWNADASKRLPNTGIGISCGTEKGSYLATCAEVYVDDSTKAISVTRVTQAFDCGPIHNPAGLLSQVRARS